MLLPTLCNSMIPTTTPITSTQQPLDSKEQDSSPSNETNENNNQQQQQQQQQIPPSEASTQSDSQQEDLISTAPKTTLSKIRFFAVFDGHGGQLASTYISSTLHRHLYHSPLFPSSPIQALHSTFLHVDSLYSSRYPIHGLQDGTTACVLVLIGSHLYCSNLGDSRAILVQKRSTFRTLLRS